VVVSTLLLPPGGQAGDKRRWERQMAAAAVAGKEKTRFPSSPTGEGVSAPSGFRHQRRTNRISRGKRIINK